MYRTLNEHYREKFGCKVYKLAIDAGFSCPNRDGTAGTGGCIFCSASGGGEFAEQLCGSVSEQLERAKTLVEQKNKAGKYIAKIALKRSVKPIYTLGLGYKCLSVLCKLLPCQFRNWIVGLLYAR